MSVLGCILVPLVCIGAPAEDLLVLGWKLLGLLLWGNLACWGAFPATQTSQAIDYKQKMEFFLIATWAFIVWVLKTENPFKN